MGERSESFRAHITLGDGERARRRPSITQMACGPGSHTLAEKSRVELSMQNPVPPCTALFFMHTLKLVRSSLRPDAGAAHAIRCYFYKPIICSSRIVLEFGEDKDYNIGLGFASASR
jgi:hypothetical protein